jgi:hypothetical protein
MDMNLSFGDGIRGSGKVATVSRNVSGFSKIDTQGAYDVDVVVGPKASLKITGDDNLLPLVETRVEQGTLVLTSKKNLNPRKSLKVTITTPSLESFMLKGAGDVDIKGIEGNDFSLSLFGAGDLRASGTVRNLNATLKGAGDMNLFGLRAENAVAELSGAGDVSVYATKYLKARVSGVGDLRYKGHPEKVEKSSSGVGDIHEAD